MPDYRALESLSEVEYLVDLFLTSDIPYVAFDLETGYSGVPRDLGSLRVYEDSQHIAGISLSNHVDWARYIPLNHTYEGNLPSHEVWELLKPVFLKKTILAHNLAFDMRNVQAVHLKGDGPEIIFDKVEDTMLQSYVLAQTQYHGLKFLTDHHFGYSQSSLKELFPDEASWSYRDAKRLRFSGLPIAPHVVRYVCDDARWVIGLYEKFTEELSKPENRRLAFIYKIEKEILGILCDMQNTGVKFDWEAFDEDWANGRFMQDFLAREVRTRFAEELGVSEFKHIVNFNSAQQMRKLLYEDLGLVTTRLTKSGAPSTDEVALLGLASQSPGAAKLSHYKKFMKNLGFYKTWDVYRESYDGRIHSNMSQTLVPSGRFASNDPNIQNIKKEFWFQVSDDPRERVQETGMNGQHYWHGSHRGYIIASEGYTLLSFDVSQGELRVLAGVANEPYLKQAFDTGLDIHKATASKMLNIPMAALTKEDRSIGKVLNFSLLYQQGAKALGENLNVSYDEAVSLMEQYFSAFKSVHRWIENQKKLGRSLGYVETFMGRRVTLWDLQSQIENVQSRGDRVGVNAPIQGGLADIVKLGMIRSARALKEKGWWNDKVRLLMNQHDSLVFEAHSSLQLEDVYDVLIGAVEFNPSGQYKLYSPDGKLKTHDLSFPDFVTDWEFGNNWGNMEEFTR